MVHTIFSLSSFDPSRAPRLSGPEGTDAIWAALNRWPDRSIGVDFGGFGKECLPEVSEPSERPGPSP